MLREGREGGRGGCELEILGDSALPLPPSLPPSLSPHLKSHDIHTPWRNLTMSKVTSTRGWGRERREGGREGKE